MRKFTITLITALCVLNVSFAATIFVDKDVAGGTGDGSSWANAYSDLQTAIDNANPLDEIWVTKGIYRPSKDKTGNASPANPRSKTFYINKAIKIHGSFNGTESLLGDRILTVIDIGTADATDVTILSGDLDDDEDDINIAGGNYINTSTFMEEPAGSNNSYTVVHVGTSAVGVEVTGTVITAGSAFNFFGASNEMKAGANFYNEGIGTTISASYLTGGFAVLNGGGLYSTTDYIILACSIFGNSAGTGGGFYNAGCNSTILAASFIANSATNGGAIYNDATTAGITCSITNGLFFINSSTGNGGCINNDGTTNSCNLSIFSSTFSSSTLYFASNADKGGVMYSDGSVTSVIHNSIIYGNIATTANTIFNNGFSAVTSINYSLVQGATAAAESSGIVADGNGMIYNQNPQFVSPVNFDLTLQASSPCINVGDNGILETLGVTTDLQAGPRFYCGKTDMGAMERSNGKGSIVRNSVIELDGVSQHVNIGNTISNFNDASDFTVEAWVNVLAYDAAATSETILTNRNLNTGINFCIAGTADGANAGKLALRIGTSEMIYSTSTIAINEWTHVAVTFKHIGSGNNIATLYINGKIEETISTADNVNASTANTLIGYETGATDAINAQIEELRIWSDVRTTEEIQGNMRLLLPCGGDNALATYEFNSTVDNVLELSGAASGDYSGTTSGGPGYEPSIIPLSIGCSGVFNVTGVSVNTVEGFDGTSLDLTFDATNHPNGNVAITYLNENYSGDAPFNPTIAGTSGQYVVDNFGTVETGLDYTIQFNQTDAIDLSSAASEYSLEKRGGNESGAWVVVAEEASAVNNVSGSKHLEFTLTGQSFSQLMPTLGNLLPVEMSVFTANLKGQVVYLDWQTASELNNVGFDIEKSTDGQNWETIGFVEGAGTTYDMETYQFTDNEPTEGVNYYRLKQNDIDGAFEYSQIRSIHYGQQLDAIAIYPNPTKDNLTIDLGNNTATVLVFDLTGRLLVSSVNNKNSIQTIDFSNFENGVYILQIKGEQWQKTEKIVVQH